MDVAEALSRVRAAQAEQQEHERAYQAGKATLANTTAAAVADLVVAAGTQEKAAALLGITQGRVAALVKRARALDAATPAAAPAHPR